MLGSCRKLEITLERRNYSFGKELRLEIVSSLTVRHKPSPTNLSHHSHVMHYKQVSVWALKKLGGLHPASTFSLMERNQKDKRFDKYRR